VTDILNRVCIYITEFITDNIMKRPHNYYFVPSQLKYTGYPLTKEQKAKLAERALERKKRRAENRKNSFVI
jgi:hypothetical protein